MISKKHLAMAACTMLLLAACKKDKEEELDLDYTAASDNARSDDAFDDMMAQVDVAATNGGLRGMDDGCDPAITIDTIAMPHTLDIDFGTVNCEATNGRVRRGMIHVTFTGPYRAQGTAITITPVNYYVNDNHVEGLKTVTNMGLNNDGDLYYTVVLDGVVTAADGSWTHSRHADRVRTWISGSDTPTWLDDVYSITGGGTGINRRGIAYTTLITTALRVEHGCAWRVTQGVVQITPENKPVRTLDYGNGSCDNVITVTVNGQTFTRIIGG